MRGTFVRATWMAPVFVLGALSLLVGFVASGCADTEPAESQSEQEEAGEQVRPAQALPAVVTEDRPILPEGPPSGHFADEDFGIEFRHQAFLERSVAPGRGYGRVTLRYGNGRIVITTYDEPMAARNLTRELRSAVEQRYRYTVFPTKMPRLTRVGETSVPQRRTHSPTKDWDISVPEPLPSELEYEDQDLAYTQFRIDTWEQFKRDEEWVLESDPWTPFTRTTPEGLEFQGFSGVAYFNGERYLVMLEAVSDISRPVHIVYFYPYEDYPVMREVIATVRETMRVN